MKNILARGGIEFLAVLLGITLSLYIDQQIEESAIVKNEKSLLSDLQVSLNQDIDYAHEVLKDMRGSIDAQEILINYECNEVENLTPKELGVLFGTVIRGSTSLFPRYGVYRSLVSNSEMKYITNLYQYGLGEFLVENFGFYRGKDFQIVEKHLLINKDAFCDGSLQKEVMKISSMTGVVHWMLEEIVESMNEVNLLIDEELN